MEGGRQLEELDQPRRIEEDLTRLIVDVEHRVRARSSWSSGMRQASSSPRSSKHTIAVKCDLPLPKLPCRYAAWLRFAPSAEPMSPSARSIASTSRGVATYSSLVTRGLARASESLSTAGAWSGCWKRSLTSMLFGWLAGTRGARGCRWYRTLVERRATKVRSALGRIRPGRGRPPHQLSSAAPTPAPDVSSQRALLLGESQPRLHLLCARFDDFDAWGIGEDHHDTVWLGGMECGLANPKFVP